MSRGRAWPALLSALVILLQGLIPAAAVAHGPGGGGSICTRDGLKLSGGGAHQDHGFGGLACEHCVIASFAALTPEALLLPSGSSRAAPAGRIEVRAFAPRARAPPRPPSTAPPAFA